MRVLIADPDEKVKIQDSLLFKGEEQLTDLTDQELFFEIDIKPLVMKHNELRIKTINKEESAKFGKEIYLEPVKIRDLVMTVVDIVRF